MHAACWGDVAGMCVCEMEIGRRRWHVFDEAREIPLGYVFGEAVERHVTVQRAVTV